MAAPLTSLERAAADGWDHRDLVAVGERGGIAVGRLVAVDPHPRRLENRSELRRVRGPRRGQELTDGGGVEGVLGPPGSLAGAGEQPQPDGQVAISATPSLITTSLSAEVDVSKA